MNRHYQCSRTHCYWKNGPAHETTYPGSHARNGWTANNALFDWCDCDDAGDVGDDVQIRSKPCYQTDSAPGTKVRFHKERTRKKQTQVHKKRIQFRRKWTQIQVHTKSVHQGADRSLSIHSNQRQEERVNLTLVQRGPWGRPGTRCLVLTGDRVLMGADPTRDSMPRLKGPWGPQVS